MMKKLSLNQLIILCFGFILLSCGNIFAQTPKPKPAPESSDTIFERVFTTLKEKPKWLFSEDVCPFDLIPNYETQVEYLSEGCAADAEICLNKCKNNDGNACYALALLIQEKKQLLQDESEFLFLRSCKLGVRSGCTNRAAGMLDMSNPDENKAKCSVKTFEKTCELNDSWGCTMFGLFLFQGIGTEKNAEKALKILPKACQYGEGNPACQAANGIISEIKKQKDK